MFPRKYMQKERTTLEDNFANELISCHLKYPVLTTVVTISLKKALNMFIHPLFQLIGEKYPSLQGCSCSYKKWEPDYYFKWIICMKTHKNAFKPCTLAA